MVAAGIFRIEMRSHGKFRYWARMREQERIDRKMYGRRQWKKPAASLLLNLHIKSQSAQHIRIILHILAGEGLLAGKRRRLRVFFIFNDPQI